MSIYRKDGGSRGTSRSKNAARGGGGSSIYGGDSGSKGQAQSRDITKGGGGSSIYGSPDQRGEAQRRDITGGGGASSIYGGSSRTATPAGQITITPGDHITVNGGLDPITARTFTIAANLDTVLTETTDPFPSGTVETANFSLDVEEEGVITTYFFRGTAQGETIVPFSATSTFTGERSSVFDSVPGALTMTVMVTDGTLTGISNPMPTSGVIDQDARTILWVRSAADIAEGTYNYSADAEGTGSDGETTTVTLTGSYTRFVPEYVMATEPNAFSDFTGDREPETTVTGVGNIATFWATTRDLGDTFVTQVMGFNLDVPRVGVITSDADLAGNTHTYNVYRISIDSGTTVNV